ncbi:MAG: phage Gp37/Gp68 family protein [Candidatus Omnitrophica bacterium]|nr:phage Gp37/Gp68 family protein [Candidatus Omnitrophota bacterium]
MSLTKIEWCTASWSPVTGCSPVSIGCQNCYAERMARRLAGRYGYPKAPNHFNVTLHPDRMDEPLRWRKPRIVFVCSMGDLFHEEVRFEWIAYILGMPRRRPQDTFIVLTKRPVRMREIISRWNEAGWQVPSNLWLGVTAENQATADERIPELLPIPTAVRFVSCEPLLGPIDLRPYLKDLDWVIVGGETGPGWRYYSEDAEVTHFWLNEFIKKHGPIRVDSIKEIIFPELWLNWVRDLRNQCKDAKVPFFFKKPPGGGKIESDGFTLNTPDNLKIRQWPYEKGADRSQQTADSKQPERRCRSEDKVSRH